MAKPNGWQQRAISRGRPLPPIPDGPTSFDLLLRRVGIGIELAAVHPVVKAWVKRFYRTKYVPETVLDALDIPESVRA